MKSILIKGGGDIGSGIAFRLHRCGFSVMVLDIKEPMAIRLSVSYANAIYENEIIIEGIRAIYCRSIKEITDAVSNKNIPIITDSKLLKGLKIDVLIDATLSKRNIKTKINDAPLVIGCGPGFKINKNCHIAVETKRGHSLGRAIHEGSPEDDTGIPGEISGKTEERVVRAPLNGIWKPNIKIGDKVEIGDLFGYVSKVPISSKISGIVRGSLHEGLRVKRGEKIGDIDPRGIREYAFIISDKALAIAGGVVEAILFWHNKRGVV